MKKSLNLIEQLRRKTQGLINEKSFKVSRKTGK